MRKIIINLSNRWLYTLIGLLVLGVGFFVVNAAVDKTQAWHSADQIEVTTSFCNQITGHGCGSDTDTNTWRPAQTLSIAGQKLSISSGNSVTLPSSSWPAGSYCILANGACPSGFNQYSLGLYVGAHAHDMCAVGNRAAGSSSCSGGLPMARLTIVACCK